MKKILLFIVFSGNISWASDEIGTYEDFQSGYEDAIKYCIDKTPSKSTELDCMKAVKTKGPYFEKAVILICDRASTWKTTINCLRAGAGRTSIKAAQACDRASKWETTIKCLNTVSDKFYLDIEVKNCDSYSTWDGTIQCFEASGISY